MGKIHAKNYALIRFMVIILVISLLALFGYLAYTNIISNSSLYYIFDNELNNYNDIILKNYSEYIFFTDEYEIKKDLNEKDFKNHYYIASFQEYDSCQEKKIRKVKDIDIKDDITITYKIYNKCGWCKGRTMLFLIKVDKLPKDEYIINYEYDYEKKLDCDVTFK